MHIGISLNVKIIHSRVHFWVTSATLEFFDYFPRLDFKNLFTIGNLVSSRLLHVFTLPGLFKNPPLRVFPFLIGPFGLALNLSNITSESESVSDKTIFCAVTETKLFINVWSKIYKSIKTYKWYFRRRPPVEVTNIWLVFS